MKSLKSLLLIGTMAGLFAGCQTHDHGAATASGAKAYPLKTCLVSDEKLGSMGDPIVDVYDGQEIKFCCKSCVADFKKDPKKYLAKIK
jgi:hypothetical protein